MENRRKYNVPESVIQKFEGMSDSLRVNLGALRREEISEAEFRNRVHNEYLGQSVMPELRHPQRTHIDVREERASRDLNR